MTTGGSGTGPSGPRRDRPSSPRRGRDDRRGPSRSRGGRDRRQSDEPEAPVRRSLGGGAPPPRPPGSAPSQRKKAEIPRPELPGERPQIPGGVLRDIRRSARGIDVEDVANAVGTAGLALEEGDVDRAVELLTWASTRAPRSTSIREGLGVAQYLAGAFEEAQRELQAYRRMSGRTDQNHLLADSARALGRTDKVIELVDEMLEAHRAGLVPDDRVVEAVIVQAGIRADGGDYQGALATLDRAPLGDDVGEPHARAWYAAGDIAARMGDRERAVEYFRSVAAVDEEFLDVDDRLAELGDADGA